MATKAFSAQGTVVKRGNGATVEVFTAIPEIKTIGGPTGASDLLEATNLDSTAKEYVLGLADSGEIRLGMNWDPTNAVHVNLYTDWQNRTKRNFQIIFSDTGAALMAFAAFVQNYEISGGVNAIVEASITLKITGAVTLTP